MNTERAAAAPTPWWRVGMVWVVIGGPLAVVVAATVTAFIAVRGADIVLTEAPAAKDGRADAETPALAARNHAATSERVAPR